MATAIESAAPTVGPTSLEKDAPVETQLRVNSAVATDSEKVRVVKPSEYKQAALSLAEAFRHDQVSAYFIETPDRTKKTAQEHWELHVAYMEYITLAHCLSGLVTTIGENYGAVALWIPPNKDIDSLLTLCRSGLWRLSYKLSLEGKKRLFREFVPLLHDTKQSVLGPRDKSSWYLMYIGTRPEATRRGYARRLIEDVTVHADRDGLPCYLESSNDINPIIYNKLGFETVRRIHLQRADKVLNLDIMVREPVGRNNAEEKGGCSSSEGSSSLKLV